MLLASCTMAFYNGSAPHFRPPWSMLLLCVLVLQLICRAPVLARELPYSTTNGINLLFKTYPDGDCATQCSHRPASGLRKCTSTGNPGSPPVNTICQAISQDAYDNGEECPVLRYPDAYQPEGYCMPRFTKDCSNPDNIGCSASCILYVILTYHCVTDAYSEFVGTNGTFNNNCTYCNMCRDGAFKNSAAFKQQPYVVIRARGDTGGLFLRHYLVLPKKPCVGLESKTPGCTDDAGEYIWSSVYREATEKLGFDYSGGFPDWAIMINAPNQRGNHQMHIHIAGFDEERTPPPDVDRSNYLVRKMARYFGYSRNADKPTKILGEGYYDPFSFNCSYGEGDRLKRPPANWARAYAVFVPTSNPIRDLGRTLKPFDIARRLAAASDLPSHSYGIIIMPRKFGANVGLVIGAVWSTSDWEQLDQSEFNSSEDVIRFSRSCWNYVGVPPFDGR